MAHPIWEKSLFSEQDMDHWLNIISSATIWHFKPSPTLVEVMAHFLMVLSLTSIDTDLLSRWSQEHTHMYFQLRCFYFNNKIHSKSMSLRCKLKATSFIHFSILGPRVLWPLHPGPWFNIKSFLTSIRNPIEEIKQSYLHSGISYTGNMASFIESAPPPPWCSLGTMNDQTLYSSGNTQAASRDQSHLRCSPFW